MTKAGGSTQVKACDYRFCDLLVKVKVVNALHAHNYPQDVDSNKLTSVLEKPLNFSDSSLPLIMLYIISYRLCRTVDVCLTQ